MAILKCKMCGGTLEIENGESVAECEYCGTRQTLAKSDDEILVNLFNRANNLRIKSEFDKAREIYEKIILKNPTDSEAYWGIVLCKYGIEYVEEPETYKRVPTCHRTLIDSVLSDMDFLAALEHADNTQKRIYEIEAREIDSLQNDIIKIADGESPFDVFICYKETNPDGTRTKDSVLANDIYYELTQEGYKVFYSAITLEDKLGTEYEPYIYSALNSAKVMLVIGTTPENFNSVWVRNEWSRYLKMIKSDRSKVLIPCYKDMDAYDLPEEFSHLQAQNMGKIGFINDIIRGINKIIRPIQENENTRKIEPVLSSADFQIEPLLKRCYLFLEDGEFSRADEFCEKILNINPELGEAYIIKLLIEFKCREKQDLSRLSQPLSISKNYAKVLRFGTESEIFFVKKADEENKARAEQKIKEQAEERMRRAVESQKISKNGRIDFTELVNNDEYFDVTCPYCGAELSYAIWQADEESDVVCPECNGEFKMNFGGVE